MKPEYQGRRNKLGDDFTLPSIHIHNRVTDGEVKIQRSHVTQQHLPTPKQNGGLTQQRLTAYRHDGSRYKAESVSGQPSKNSQVEDSGRLVYSAPNKKGRTGPLPKLNNLVNERLDPIITTSSSSQATGYAGLTTKERDTSSNRQGKFATSWANTRVTENIVRSEIREIKTKPEKTSQPKRQTETKDGKPIKAQPNNFGFHATDTSKEKPEERQKIISGEDKERLERRRTDMGNRERQKNDKENKVPVNPGDKRNQSNTESNNRDDQETVETHNADQKHLIDKETEIKRLARLGLGKVRYRESRSPVSPRRKWREPLGVVEEKNTRRKSKREEEAELTFKPNINRTNEVFTVYTGLTKKDVRHDHSNKSVSNSNTDRDDVNGGSKTSSSIHAPTLTSPHQKEYILTRREARAYLNMHSAYNNSDIKKQRKAKLLEKLSEAQLAEIKHHNETLRLKEKQRQESKLRQQRQLTYLRRKFHKEQTRRFRSQYVTNRVLEHEIMNRNDFGLPEEVDESVSFSAKLKRKKQKPIESVSKTELRKQNEKKLEKMLSAYNSSPSPQREKVPKMEGIDTIEILEKDKNGKMVEKKKMVADIIKEAEREIKLTSEHDDEVNDKEFGYRTSKYGEDQQSKPSSNNKPLSTKPSISKNPSTHKPTTRKDQVTHQPKTESTNKPNTSKISSPSRSPTNKTKVRPPQNKPLATTRPPPNNPLSSSQPSQNKTLANTRPPPNKAPAPSKPPPVRDIMNISIDSLDLDDDDDDIFERARKKYGLDIDSSLDTNSRN